MVLDFAAESLKDVKNAKIRSLECVSFLIIETPAGTTFLVFFILLKILS